MMLSHPQMDAVIDFSMDKVNTLIIENPDFLREFLRDIVNQINGYSGKAILSQNDKPIDFSRNAEVIDRFFPFEINQKQLISKIVSRMESVALNEENYLQTAKLMGELEQYLLEMSSDLPCEVVCSKINIGSVLHAAGIEIPDDYENDLEKIIDYMELVREFDRRKLFVTVNLRSYYSDDFVEIFLETILSHEYNVLMIESISRKRLLNEQRITIDSDLCEF